MDEIKSSSTTFWLPPGSSDRGTQHADTGKVLPRVLGRTTRSAGSERNPFINDRVIDVESVFDLSGAARGAEGSKRPQPISDHSVLSLEASDGTTLIIRADKLKEDLQRLYPAKVALLGEASLENAVDLSVLKDQEAAARGVTSWIWSTLTVLNLKPDGLVEAAKDKALELLKDKIGGEFEDLAHAGASWAGAKGLMWAVESQLKGKPGLYRWGTRKQLHVEDRVKSGDERLEQAANDNKPLLLFIHGTEGTDITFFVDRKDHDQGYA